MINLSNIKINFLECQESNLGCWVRSENPTSVLCSPPPLLSFFQMNTILGFKSLSEEDLEDNPCPVPLRDKMIEFHDSLMQVMAISSLEEEDVEIEPKSNERPSVLSVIIKVSP